MNAISIAAVFAVFVIADALAADAPPTNMPAPYAPACDQVCDAGPVSFPEVKDWDTLAITLTRGACFGTCPIYSVTILGDGRVEYEGDRFTAQPGKHESEIEVAAVRALFAKFRAADFFSLKDEYRAQVTDNPTFTVTLTFDGRVKRVVDYVGREVGMPQAVTDLENAIDEAASTAQWVK